MKCSIKKKNNIFEIPNLLSTMTIERSSQFAKLHIKMHIINAIDLKFFTNKRLGELTGCKFPF